MQSNQDSKEPKNKNPDLSTTLATEPQAVPPAPAPTPPAAPASPNSPGVVVLQWLTYAFWGWTVLALSSLTAAVLTTFIAQSDTSAFSKYALAAILVLLPLSLACDIFYSKYEPVKKTGAATVVMVIHAVIFALFGIGSLIVAVFSVVQMLTGSGDSTPSQIALYTSLIIFVVYLAVFLRTLNLEQTPWIRKAFIAFMLVAVGTIGALGIFGPIAHERATRDDRLITSNLYEIQQAIEDYAKDNNKLPEKLSDVNAKGDAAELIERNLVKYTPNTLKASTTTSPSSRSSRTTITPRTKTEFYYTLCVNYKKPSSKYNSKKIYDPSLAYPDDGEYSTYVYASNHPAGEVCYKLKTFDYSDIDLNG